MCWPVEEDLAEGDQDEEEKLSGLMTVFQL